MWMNDVRKSMLRALLLDWLGQVLILVLIVSSMDLTVIDLSFESLQRQGPWLVFMLLLHPLLGWLFGSYRSALAEAFSDLIVSAYFYYLLG